MKKIKLTKKNKRELKAISAVLILVAIVFLWIVQTIGLPIETYVDRGRIKVIDVSSYNGTVNWKKVKDQKINHAMLKIGSGSIKIKKEAKTVSLAQTSVMQDMQRFIVEFIIILMQGQSMMRRKKQSTVSVC
ncbi:MAG: hypothetical protein ACLVI9_11625 [Anaerostipes hadrus]